MPLYRHRQLNTMEGRARDRFNKVASSCRIVVEQCLGTMKIRFPILHDTMRFKHGNIPRVILCCMGLHNFFINTGSGYFDDYENMGEEATVDDLPPEEVED